jgi:hypothetical protein
MGRTRSTPNRILPVGEHNRKQIAWRDQAKAQLRAIDQPTALRLLRALAHFAATGEGDVKRLRDISAEPVS